MSQDNVQLVRRLYEAFGKGDVGAVISILDPGIDWLEAEGFIYADRNPYKGSQAVLEGVFLRFATEWDGFTVSPQEWLDAGDHVVVFGTYTGTYKNTQKSVRAPFAHIWGVAGSKVVKYRQFTDTKQFGEITAR